MLFHRPLADGEELRDLVIGVPRDGQPCHPEFRLRQPQAGRTPALRFWGAYPYSLGQTRVAAVERELTASPQMRDRLPIALFAEPTPKSLQ